MPSLVSDVNLALRALLSHQQSIEVTEHNVANANTPGYRRQSAVLATAPAYAAPGLQNDLRLGQVGQGVTVSGIRRFTLQFFDGRYRTESAATRQAGVARQALTQVEATLAETGGDSLPASLDAFWKSWLGLSSDPTNTALRADVRQQAGALTGAFNRRAQALNALRADQDQEIGSRVGEINTLALQVAQLNGDVARVQAVGQQPNDLLDERDRALDRLAELSGAVSYQQDNGQVVVSIGGHALVVGQSAQTLTAAPDLANRGLLAVTWQTGERFAPEHGELAGLFDVRDRVIPAQQAGLNAVAQALAGRVNTLHRAGSGLPPANATGLDFFTPFATTDYALELKVNGAMDNLQNIAAATAPNQPGDGGKALAAAGVENELLLNGGTATLAQYYNAQVGSLGREVRQATDGETNHKLVLDSLTAQRESVGGVSLDEEAARLIQSQRAYQAAARLMTTVDEMLDRVINGMGRVGL